MLEHSHDLIGGIRLIQLGSAADARGKLTFGYFDSMLPFVPNRFFTIYDVPEGQRRGGHAHTAYSQVMICLMGQCRVHLDNGVSRCTIDLAEPEHALFLPPRIWADLSEFSRNAVVLVFASGPYDRTEYVEDYSEFTRLVSRGLG